MGRNTRRGNAGAPYWLGVTAASIADHYATTGATGIAGSAAGFWVAVPLKVLTRAIGAATRRVAARTNYFSEGWQIYVDGTCSTITFAAYSGAGAYAGTVAHSIPAGDVGGVHVVHGVHTGAELQLWWDGAKISAATVPITGYTAYAGATVLGSNAVDMTGLAVYGLVGGAGVPSDAQIQAHYAACRGAMDVHAITGVTDHRWSIKRGPLPALTDLAGADTMAVAGAPGYMRSRS